MTAWRGRAERLLEDLPHDPKCSCPKCKGLLASSACAEKEAWLRFDVLMWAASRPGVLSLLEALRAANYDETGAEYLARAVKQGPRCETRPALTEPWPFDDRSSYESMPYESMPIPIPIIDPEDPPRVTVEHIDAPARSWSVGPDDFPGEDYPPSVAVIKLERAWEGRTCAMELCSEKATGEVYTWALGNIPICDKHR